MGFTMLLKCLRLLAASLLIAASVQAESATVTHVYDGDTMKLQNGNHVRLLGINAPEVSHSIGNGRRSKTQPYGAAARNRLAELVQGKTVRLETDREARDHYNRILAYVYLPDGTLINEAMIKGGLAYCLPRHPNTRHAEKLLEAQQRAMKLGKGIWKGYASLPDRTVIGNRRSRRFHLPGCSFGKGIARKNRIVFQRAWDAFHSGYAPCKTCLPLPVSAWR